MNQTLTWLASLRLQPEVMMQIARAAQSSQGEATVQTSKQLTEVQKLKAECRQAESAYRIIQNNVKQALAKSKKIAEELETQNQQIIMFLGKEKEFQIVWQSAIDNYDAAEMSKQLKYDQEIQEMQELQKIPRCRIIRCQGPRIASFLERLPLNHKLNIHNAFRFRFRFRLCFRVSFLFSLCHRFICCFILLF